MCLILFALHSHPDFPLIVAANRDEFFQRPTDCAQPWGEAGGILAGRDRQAGGTWMGISDTGRFAAVTNVRDGRVQLDRPRSRGELPVGYLRDSTLSPSAYFDALSEVADQYNGFNLLVGGPDELHYLGNHPDQQQQLEAGVYGLSNASLDSPWPKVMNGKAELTDILKRDWTDLKQRQEDLFGLLANRERAPDNQLPDTGINREWESLLSPRFIHSQDYGTRASTLVLYHRSGEIEFVERNFDREGEQETRRFRRQTAIAAEVI
ncbi:NRDE family protein [Pseudomaricurvus alkylphenolicus]|jgi:uncharacterized protein with NRDE domain|uniref:NRDE family protein n=1 Tax=Pseudomaricurvus alkylphenolicus TaxID=1306991 RepID=UPI0014239AE4|nr:NRDE family protein [Pseudomaricurvus alkylphenolicus]NIB42804.1 NRDE family protein [Pseudomaricurvus alkylphenolicus]